jgi:hypothetical protein
VHTRLFVVLLWTIVQAHAAEFWNGAVRYDPPYAMSGGPAGVPWPTNGWKFVPYGFDPTSNGLAQVEFRLETVDTFTERATVSEIRGLADFRKFVEDKLRATGLASHYSLRLIEVDSRPALCCVSRTNLVIAPNLPAEWTCSVYFFWETNSVWRNSTLCEIMIDAQRRETFSLLTNSLMTVRVRPEKLVQREH